MDYENLDLPKVYGISGYKKRLRAALLSAHESSSGFRIFGRTVLDFTQSMSKLQKGLAFSAFAAAAVVVGAGLLGPSAFSVAQAQAQEVVNRAFVKIANLSDEERAALEEKFQERIQFHIGGNRGFMAFQELSPEEIEAHHAEMKASLAGALTEAKAAPDLQIVSADELPTPGFVGRAGRAFGFRMMHNPENLEEKLANLPEDVRREFEERQKLHEEMAGEMAPVSFMKYTDESGATVYIGVNAEDEPVTIMKFLQSEDGEVPFPPQGKKMFFFGRTQSAE